MNAQRKHAVSAPAHVAQDRLTEAVRNSTANPRPANDPSVSRRIAEGNARYIDNPAGLRAVLADAVADHAKSLRNTEYLLSSILEAAREDASWAQALCEIGAGWILHQSDHIEELKEATASACAEDRSVS